MLLIDPTGRGLPVHSCYPPVLRKGYLQRGRGQVLTGDPSLTPGTDYSTGLLGQ